MRLESMKPQNQRETDIRRRAHARAILKGITMRQAVFEALELWLAERYNSIFDKKNPTNES